MRAAGERAAKCTRSTHTQKAQGTSRSWVGLFSSKDVRGLDMSLEDIGRAGATYSMVQSNGHASSSSNERTKHKQQRLLHHSSKRRAEEGTCKVCNYCADMKRLWRHMADCVDPHCRTPHCFSSRSILSHYRKCQDRRCPICVPVRKSVKEREGRSLPRGVEVEVSSVVSVGESNLLRGQERHQRRHGQGVGLHHGLLVVHDPSSSPFLRTRRTQQ